MVEVEVNPANVTVSKFPPHEDVLQLFTAEWPIAQKAAGTSQQNKEKEQETHKVAFCRVDITNRFSTLEHISQEAGIKETRVCPQHRGDSKWCKTQTQKIGKRRIREATTKVPTRSNNSGLRGPKNQRIQYSAVQLGIQPGKGMDGTAIAHDPKPANSTFTVPTSIHRPTDAKT